MGVCVVIVGAVLRLCWVYLWVVLCVAGGLWWVSLWVVVGVVVGVAGVCGGVAMDTQSRMIEWLVDVPRGACGVLSWWHTWWWSGPQQHTAGHLLRLAAEAANLVHAFIRLIQTGCTSAFQFWCIVELLARISWVLHALLHADSPHTMWSSSWKNVFELDMHLLFC